MRPSPCTGGIDHSSLFPHSVSAHSSTMATSAAALRAKMFTSGPAVTAPANTEGLRQATDALLRQQTTAEATVSIYRTKLGEAQEAVARLQAAYVEQAQINGRLQGERLGPPQRRGGRTDFTADRSRRTPLPCTTCPPPCAPRPAAKVKNDHEVLTKLQTAVNAAVTHYAKLHAERQALAQELAAAEEQREALADAFAAKAAAQAGLEAALTAACEAGKDLQGRLDAAAAVHATMTTDLAAAHAEAADKVGCMGLGHVQRCSACCEDSVSDGSCSRLVQVGRPGQLREPLATAQHPPATPPPACSNPPSSSSCHPLSQGKELTAAERRAEQLGTDLAAVRNERDGLTAWLATTTAQLEQAKQDLAAKTSLLEEEQSAKVGRRGGEGKHGRAGSWRNWAWLMGVACASRSPVGTGPPHVTLPLPHPGIHGIPALLLQAKLEASLEEHKAAEEQLTAELALVKEVAKAAEVGAAGGCWMAGWAATAAVSLRSGSC